jgi:hypothetical protein
MRKIVIMKNCSFFTWVIIIIIRKRKWLSDLAFTCAHQPPVNHHQFTNSPIRRLVELLVEQAVRTWYYGLFTWMTKSHITIYKLTRLNIIFVPVSSYFFGFNHCIFFLLQISLCMFKFFGFGPLKLKSAGNLRIFLQIFLRILALGTKIKMICTYRD